MSVFASYPKIYALGHPDIAQIFDGSVVVEEKIDGSQFSFCVINDKLKMRSRGADVIPGNIPELFKGAAATAQRLHEEDKLIWGWVYRGEALQSKRHNTLCYDRVPTGNFILFDIMCGPEDYADREDKGALAQMLGLEVVPGAEWAKAPTLEELKQFLELTSCLGGAKLEGVVVKNYARFGRDGKPLMGKYVSEAFKEMHQKAWKKTNPQKGDMLAVIAERICTEARWHKAVQHLAERGVLTNSPVDIGPLMKEVHMDIDAECLPEITDTLLKWALPHIKRRAAAGLPQWYKDELAKNILTDVVYEETADENQ